MKTLVKPLIFVALTLIGTVSCKKSEEKADIPENEIINVELGMVRKTDTIMGLKFSGTIEPSQTIPLTFQTFGIVEKVLVEEGDAVKKGQLIAIVDKADAQNMYNIANAKYLQAQDAYERLKMVHDKGSLTEVKWVEMETNLKQAQSSVDLAAENLKKCNLYAPDYGIIGKRNVEPGMSSVNTMNAAFDLIKINTVFVKISVPENEIAKMKKGEKATFSVSALNDKNFTGTVTNVGVVADPISRTYDVKITVSNLNLELKPGMVCDLTLSQNTSQKVLLIPYRAVSKDADGKTYVYVPTEDEKRAKKQLIEVGDYFGTEVIVTKGLSEGQKIITEGSDKLAENSLIRF